MKNNTFIIEIPGYIMGMVYTHEIENGKAVIYNVSGNPDENGFPKKNRAYFTKSNISPKNTTEIDYKESIKPLWDNNERRLERITNSIEELEDIWQKISTK
jgi:hypothetical protein